MPGEWLICKVIKFGVLQFDIQFDKSEIVSATVVD